MKTSEILKELRNDADLTQKELAKILGIGQSTIAGYEKDEREATSYILGLYADHFHVSVDYLLGRDKTWDNGIAVNLIPEYTAEERNLIKAYRELRPDLQSLLLDTVALWQKQNAPSEASKKKA